MMKINLIVFGILLLTGCATNKNSILSQTDSELRSPAGARKAKLGIANCMNLNSTLEIFACLDATYLQEDKKLNEVYQTLVKLLASKENKRVDKLRKAQIAWIRMRDEDCSYDSSADGSSEASGAADAICKIKSTTSRRADLELRLSDLKLHLAEGAL